jgi:hypothetical protein
VVAVKIELPDSETEVEMDTASGNSTSVQ